MTNEKVKTDWKYNVSETSGEMSYFSRLKSGYLSYYLIENKKVYHKKQTLNQDNVTKLLDQIKNIEISYDFSDDNVSEIIICSDYLLYLRSNSKFPGSECEILTIDPEIIKKFNL